MQRKTSAELEQLILNEVRDLPACKGLKWISIVPVQTTWRAELHGGDDLARRAECKDAIDSVVYRLRGHYDLLPEDGAAKREELTSRAEKLAGEEVDRMLKKSDQPDAVKAKRKRRLTKFPAELK
jgi:hypothetical protein